MQLLITRSTVPHFYRIDEPELNELIPLDFSSHEIGQPTLKIKRQLPWEICSIIMHYLFQAYLHDHNYDMAGALVAINRSFVNEIYNSVYWRSKGLALKDMVRRMSNTLYTLERIHDDYFTTMRQSQFTACRIIKSGIATRYCPWDFTLDCFAGSHYGVIAQTGTTVHQFEVGPLNGDLVWLTGRYLKDGSFDCKQFKHPILNLEITNIADQNPITSTYCRRNRAFKKFVDLLKRCYGPNLGVHVLFNDQELDNPFDLTEQGFMEF